METSMPVFASIKDGPGRQAQGYYVICIDM
jgi:hypothetical protein